MSLCSKLFRGFGASQITARQITDGTVFRDASQFKVANYVMVMMNENELTEEEKIIAKNREEQNMQIIIQQSTYTNERNISQMGEENSNVEEKNSSNESEVRQKKSNNNSQKMKTQIFN